MTVEEAQAGLLNIIELVQEGILTPAEAMQELANLKELAKGSGFKADYTLGDFILIRENALSTYDDGAQHCYEDDTFLNLSQYKVEEENE